MAWRVFDSHTTAQSFHNLFGDGQPPTPCRARWTFARLHPFRLGPAQVEALHLTLSGNGREQSLEGLARGNFGHLALTAQGPLLAEKRGQMNLEAKELQPAFLGVSHVDETQISGRFAGTFYLAGPEPILSGETTAGGRINGYPLSELKATFSWKRSRLEVARAAVRLGDLAAEIKGSLTGENLDFQTQGRLAQGPLPWQPSVKAAGPLIFQGHLRGSLANPHVSLSASSRRLSSLALASCLGASWVFGGHSATLEALSRMVEPGGWVVVGEPSWLQEPPEAYLEALGVARNDFGTHSGNVEAGELRDLELVHTFVSNQDDWDKYEGLQWYATAEYARSHQGDQDLPELLQRVAKEKSAYLRWGRNTLGWAIYVFRQGATRGACPAA